jgi:hypothetical protein
VHHDAVAAGPLGPSAWPNAIIVADRVSRQVSAVRRDGPLAWPGFLNLGGRLRHHGFRFRLVAGLMTDFYAPRAVQVGLVALLGLGRDLVLCGRLRGPQPAFCFGLRFQVDEVLLGA